MSSSTPFHIGIDASRMSVRERTGTERYSYEVIAGITRQDRFHRYTLYCNAVPPQLPPLGTNVRLRSIPQPRLWTHTRLALEIRRETPDVLFVPAHIQPFWCAAPSVVTIHDLGYLFFPEAHTPRRRLELHLSTRWSARNARHIIAVSQATRRDLIEHYQIAPEKITVVPHGVGPHFQAQADTEKIAALRKRYELLDEHGQPLPFLLYVGTLQPRKNLVRIIEAFSDLVHGRVGTSRDQTKLARLQLVLAGKRGWYTDTIIARAGEEGISERVRFPGFIPDDELPTFVQAARAFVFPSLYEGFGIPVLEAMACGTPVLTSTTSSLPEVAGEAALLVEPDDRRAIAEGMARLAIDDSLHANLRERGLKHVPNFTWERSVEATRNVLYHVASEAVAEKSAR